MNTRHLCSLAAALMLAYAPAALAADEAAQIAVVNIQKIMAESTAAKNVRDQLDSKQKSFQAEISKKADALQKEKQEIAKQQSVLSKAAFEEKARAFNAKETEVQKDVQAKKAMLDGATEGALSEIQKATLDIITDMAKEKNFVIALPVSQVLYSESKMDISDEVLARLNKKLPKIEVKFEAAKAADKK